MNKNNEEIPNIIDLYNSQYDKVVELSSNGKQKELNKAVDTLLKLFSLAVLIEQQEQHYEVLAIEQEELDLLFEEMDDELQIVNVSDQVKADEINTDAILDKSIEYYTNVRSKLKLQLEQDALRIRNMSDDDFRDYINSLI
ncbi:hypothetical protein [Mammaliicoccus sciuri]|uniref:hypothetical protein n=1 Tax=Mammaliicoccus sciuri TaxID=1296 RepID=UPI002DBA5535|nr:hypothetical protein [Mammaliicoccus sciuri]MEB6232484.1 hypothetical protein [Mammaliicoccus sciuri]